MSEVYFNPMELFIIGWQLIIPLAMFVACAYFLTKKTSPESILLAIGSFLTLITSVLFNYFARAGSMDFYSGSVYSFMQGFSYLGNILFTIGFIMLIVKTIKKEEEF